MIVATFGSSTGWVGKTITYENDAFLLQNMGTIAPADIVAYDAQGHLTWSHEGLRSWVYDLASVSEAPTSPSSSPDEARTRSKSTPDEAAVAQRPRVTWGGGAAEEPSGLSPQTKIMLWIGVAIMLVVLVAAIAMRGSSGLTLTPSRRPQRSRAAGNAARLRP